jgi:hypothetical protein
MLEVLHASICLAFGFGCFAVAVWGDAGLISGGCLCFLGGICLMFEFTWLRNPCRSIIVAWKERS